MLKLAKFLILLEFYKMFIQMYPLHYLIKIALKNCFFISVKCLAPCLKYPLFANSSNTLR